MFGRSTDQKSEFVKKAQNERQKRLELKKQNVAIVKIQALARGFIAKRKFKKNIRDEFDAVFAIPESKITALQIFKVTRKLLLIYDEKSDDKRFYCVCHQILYNLKVCNEAKYWYMSVMLIKEWAIPWMSQFKHLLNLCLTNLMKLQQNESQLNYKATHTNLEMIHCFIDCSNWKILEMKGGENLKPFMQQLCRSTLTDLNSKGLLLAIKNYLLAGLSTSNISLSEENMTVTISLVFRCMSVSKTETSIMLFIENLLVVPAFIFHAQSLSPDIFNEKCSYKFFSDMLVTLASYKYMASLYSSMSADKCLCITGNLTDLCMKYLENFKEFKDKFKIVVCGLLKHCQLFAKSRQGKSKWHPLLGWHHDESQFHINADATTHVLQQIKKLWKQPLCGKFFYNLPTLEESKMLLSNANDTNSKVGRLSKAFVNAFKKSSNDLLDINEPVVMDICMSCNLYQTITSTLQSVRMEIVTDLSLQEELVVRLWRFIYCLGPSSGMKSILNYVNGRRNSLPGPLASLLLLFFECASLLISILDDIELYEKQRPFTLDDLLKLSAFLNSFVFKTLWHCDNAGDSKSDSNIEEKDVGRAAWHLLLVLYHRDSRRSFTQKGHWLIKELRMNQFHCELREKKDRALKVLSQMPHVIPHIERVKLFHDIVNDDKRVLGIDKELSRASALITVNRNRLLEDGYEQLHRFTGQQLKGIIRVKFVNEQGLDEAGIDQDGVFKEFLEDVIAKAFNPQLNLFKLTTGGEEERLYPSPTSFIHDQHLQLFEFVGKMLGKALYEGILVDVPFASFFLRQLNEKQRSILHSNFDELPSLDPEMYKNLTFVKNYEGDVSDLQLVFAYDEDVLGQMVTHDLKPGGRFIQVTNANKLTYIHLMAHFRVHTQIKEQSAAFIQGFRSVIIPEWLNMFSGPELQRLISGDAESFDLTDLKSNTVYYGGYHGNHQTIGWLWDILINEFTLKEKKEFLKFVTSCSNPPLLGFKYLEPPFSIRYVDSSENEEGSDTVSSVVRGFFNIRSRSTAIQARLPSASTCFNLLKLPCYKKKSILRDKLRYAIKSGAGFELS